MGWLSSFRLVAYVTFGSKFVTCVCSPLEFGWECVHTRFLGLTLGHVL
jgi:hypothetical protein